MRNMNSMNSYQQPQSTDGQEQGYQGYADTASYSQPGNDANVAQPYSYYQQNQNYLAPGGPQWSETQRSDYAAHISKGTKYIMEQTGYNPFGSNPTEAVSNNRAEAMSDTAEQEQRGRMRKLGGKVVGMFVRVSERRAARQEAKANAQAAADEAAMIEANRDNPSFWYSNDPRFAQLRRPAPQSIHEMWGRPSVPESDSSMNLPNPYYNQE